MCTSQYRERARHNTDSAHVTIQTVRTSQYSERVRRNTRQDTENVGKDLEIKRSLEGVVQSSTFDLWYSVNEFLLFSLICHRVKLQPTSLGGKGLARALGECLEVMCCVSSQQRSMGCAGSRFWLRSEKHWTTQFLQILKMESKIFWKMISRLVALLSPKGVSDFLGSPVHDKDCERLRAPTVSYCPN